MNTLLNISVQNNGHFLNLFTFVLWKVVK